MSICGRWERVATDATGRYSKGVIESLFDMVKLGLVPHRESGDPRCQNPSCPQANDGISPIATVMMIRDPRSKTELTPWAMIGFRLKQGGSTYSAMDHLTRELLEQNGAVFAYCGSCAVLGGMYEIDGPPDLQTTLLATRAAAEVTAAEVTVAEVEGKGEEGGDY